MTPLTHAVVGTVICQKLRGSRLGRVGWALVFPLAFASHYLLDAVPHFEDIGPLEQYRTSPWLFLALGAIGGGLAVYLFRRNRQAGLLWLTLSIWIGLAGISEPLVRVLAALALLGYIAYQTKQAAVVGYLLAGILAVAADFVPGRFRSTVRFHDWAHSQADWGASLYSRVHSAPVPADWIVRLQDPYFLLGYGLELLLEATIFFGALSIFSGLCWDEKTQTEQAAPTPRRGASV